MNKQPQTYYAIVSVEADLPADENEVFVITKEGKRRIDNILLDQSIKLNPWYSCKVTHWLSEQQGVVLSVEEWEKVQNAFELIKVRLKNLEIKECDFIIEPMERWLITTKH